MKLKNLILGFFASVAVLASCEPVEEQLGAPALNLEPETMEFDSKAGEQTLKMTATRDWAVTNDQDWLVFDPVSGSGSNNVQEIKVTVLANPGTNRTYEAQFSIGMISKTLTVSQKGDKGEAALDVTKISDFIKAADGSKICTLKGTVSNVAKGDRFWGFDINDGTGTVTAAFPANWDAWKDKIQDGGTVVVKGAYEFYDKKGTHQVKKAEIISFEAGEVVPPTEAEKISIADFIQKADTQKPYRLEGKLENLAKGDRFWGFDINDGTATVTAAFPANWDAWKDKLSEGGTVTVQGPYEFYDKKGTHQVKKCTIISFEAGSVVPPTEAEKISIADFIQKADTQKPYRLEGKLENLAKGDKFWGFDINDGTATVTAAFPANWDAWKDKLSESGTVTVQGPYEFYEKKGTHQVKKCTIIAFTAGEGGGTTPDPEKPVTGAVFSESFSTSLGQFTIEDANKPAELANGVWQYSSKFKCAVATGYTGGEGGSKLTSESSLVSPEIDLTKEKEAYIAFEQAGNYFADGKTAMSLSITKDGKTWSALTMDNSALSGFTWNDFHIDITAYAGSKIKVKFTYKSTPENCGTWEIKNFSVMKGKYVEPEKPAEPDVPAGTKVVLKTNAKDMTFAAETDAKYGAGFSATQDGVKIGYYQHNSTSTSIAPKDDHVRFYKSSAFVISLEKGGKIKYVKLVTTGGDKCVMYQAPEGKMTKAEPDIIWTGEAASPFVGEMVNGQIRVKEITIVY